MGLDTSCLVLMPPRFSRGSARSQSHPALWALAGFIGDDFGVHRRDEFLFLRSGRFGLRDGDVDAVAA